MPLNYEYKTEELKMYFENQETRINELAKEGWELITVSFNIGYFKRRLESLEDYAPPTLPRKRINKVIRGRKK